MRKLFYFFTFFFFCVTTIVAFIPIASGKTITSDIAQIAAANFFKQNTNVTVKTVTLAYTALSSSNDTAYYVFNINGNAGFVIVVADNAQYPVLGYSTEGAYVVPKASTNAGYWMEKRKNEIIANKALNVQASPEISSLWTTYLTSKSVEPRVQSNIGPLLQTLWDQGYPYNALCPDSAPTGCVATAMAQIMRYWQYPAKGTGSSSYYSNYAGTELSADYGATTYHWNNMPVGKVTNANNDVDTLMFQCGVSVEMDYEAEESGANVTIYDDPHACSQIAYTKYFGYDASTINDLQQANYSDTAWTNIIEGELNASRPVQYVGYDTQYGGHTWVCDGYDVHNNLHMNWGWSGGSDGYYSINDLAPGETPYDFSNGEEVLIGIEPPVVAENAASIQSIVSPTGTTCSSSISPTVTLHNLGTETLTSCTINYYIDSNTPQTYSWTGSLAAQKSVNVVLTALTVASGSHSFSSFVTDPNNSTNSAGATDPSTGAFTIASPALSLPMFEGFGTSLPSGWSTWNSNSSLTATWQIVSETNHPNCVGMNNCDGDGNSDMTGSKNRLITMPYNFLNDTGATLSFVIAYAPCNLNGTLYADTLAVDYSTDCGNTWTQIYIKGGTELATAPVFQTNYDCWSPSYSQWRKDIIDLTSLSGQQSVMFAFESISDWGEWIYLDSINLSGAITTGIAAVQDVESFNIYPNPATSTLTIEGPGDREDLHYALYNVLGKEVITGTIATNGNHFIQTLQVSDLAQGMYFLRITDNEHSWTTKVNIH